jgi:hypothetical protein
MAIRNSKNEPSKIVTGSCPFCGPSRICIVLERGSYYTAISGPSWCGSLWVGRCCHCLSYLETEFDEADEVERLEWTSMEEDKVEFLLGPSPPAPSDPRADPLWDVELDEVRRREP